MSLAKLRNGPLFYWRLQRHDSNRGRAYFWMTPWFTLWFLWNTSWSPSENGRFLFKGIVLEYDEKDEEGYTVASIERPWLIQGESF
jgi:hypothetical protein